MHLSHLFIIYFAASICQFGHSKSGSLNYIGSPLNPVKDRAKWDDYFESARQTKYQIISDPSMEKLAKNIIKQYPNRFYHHVTKWEKFSDGYAITLHFHEIERFI